MDYRIYPPQEIFEATAVLPRSKSIDTRALVLNYVAGQRPGQGGDCDDTTTLADILSRPFPTDGGTVNVGPAGTAMRFLTALLSASESVNCVLTGSERMLRRPIGPLVDVLRHMGADIEYSGEDGFPPLKIKGRKLSGGTVDIDASTSSQFISALMMISPLLEANITIRLLGEIQSLPYIKMTAEMLRARGAEVDFDRDKIDIYIPKGGLKPVAQGEPDWSAAAFWYELAAVTAGWVTLTGLNDSSLQGDKEVAKLFERLGVLTEFTDEGVELSATPDLYSRLEADLTDMPDAVPALAVTACLIGVPFRLSGVGALHHKECDRLEALKTELAKIGCIIDTENYGTVLTWEGRRTPMTKLPEFDTYADHRMAMALAPVSVFIPGIVVRNAEVVSKSYPKFWEQLAAAGFTLADPSEPLPTPEE